MRRYMLTIMLDSRQLEQSILHTLFSVHVNVLMDFCKYVIFNLAVNRIS